MQNGTGSTSFTTLGSMRTPYRFSLAKSSDARVDAVVGAVVDVKCGVDVGGEQATERSGNDVRGDSHELYNENIRSDNLRTQFEGGL